MLSVIYICVLIIGFLWLVKSSGIIAIGSRLSLRKVNEDYYQFFNHILFTGNLNTNTLKSVSLPRYKFYQSLCHELLKLFNVYGFNLRNQILGLRELFRKDITQEQKNKRIESGAWVQFVAIIFITWTMIFLTQYQLDLKLNRFYLKAIFLWQSLGFIAFLIIKRAVRSRLFRDIDHIVMTLSYWTVLIDAGLPLGEIFKKYKLNCDHHYPQNLAMVVSRLEELIKQSLQSGSPISSELSYFTKETWFIYEDLALVYENKLTKLKFIILAFFFLPSYFVFVYFMLDSLSLTI